MDITIEELSQYLYNLVMTYGPKLIYAIIVLIVGLWIIKGFKKGIRKLMQKRELDPSLVPFLSGVIDALLKVMLTISVMTMLGIEMTSFIAILGSAGLAVGLALSGTLQNFAGGVIILILRPFKKGDFIEAQGYSGTVKEIQIFNTHMNTPDNKLVIIPNGPLSTGSLINYSAEPRRRVDMTFGISYKDDIQKAKDILKTYIEADERILKDPAPMVVVSSLGDSSVNIVARAWVESPNYWPVFFDAQEKIKVAFDQEGISIPFPQRDIHLYNNN